MESIPSNYKTWKSPSQVFTNADQAHAHQVLNRLGLKECFDSIICFETLNPPNYTNVPTDNLALTWSNSFNKDCNQVENRCFNSKTQILCKPSVEAIEVAIQIANLDPRKTVKSIMQTKKWHEIYAFMCLFIDFGLGINLLLVFSPSSILCSCFLMIVLETLQVGKLLDLTQLL